MKKMVLGILSFFLLTALLTVMPWVTPSAQAIMIDDNTFEMIFQFNGHTYAMTRDTMNWDSARTLAIQHGGYLVSVNEGIESQFLVTNYGSGNPWIGLNDLQQAGTWRWINGELFIYANWATGEPAGANEHCVMTNWGNPGKWNNGNCLSLTKAIVEWGDDTFETILPYNGHTYAMTRDTMNWESARTLAIQQGGYLVSVNDANESSFLATNYGSGNPWIGLHQVLSIWMWANEEPWTYTNWAPGEPAGANEYCVMTNWGNPGKWNNGNCLSLTKAIVEWGDVLFDGTPPTPNPMTWATAPYASSPTQISMTATTATDSGSPPVSYYFHFSDSTTGGTGGTDSGWQGSTSYTDTGLQPNHSYGYQVKAKDSAAIPNETSYSSIAYKYTYASAPGTAAFFDITQGSIQAGWTANGNRSGTEYYCENTTMGTNSGWTTSTSWNSTGLNCNTSYAFRVKARNGDGIETAWTSLGSQSTQACGTNYTLSLAKNGNGSVKVNGTSHSLPWSGQFSSGSQVQLEAVPDSGWNFTEWSGDVTGNTNPITITMSADKTCTATFNTQQPGTYTLNITKNGNGSVKVNGTSHSLPWSGQFSSGSQVQLEALPDSGWNFTEWSGDVTGNVNPTTVPMNGNVSLTANFSQETGGAPEIEVNPKSKKFENRRIGEMSFPQSFLVSNSGNGDLILGALFISGTDSAMFSKQGDNCSGKTLKQSETCDIEIVFSPTAIGPFHADLLIPSNDSDEPALAVELQGGSGADLTGTWVSLSQKYKNTKNGTKCSLKGQVTIQNVGYMNASSSPVRFYLSDDTTYDVGDTFMKETSTGTIKSGKSKKKKLSYTLPIGEIVTGKYVIAVINADKSSLEADEDNNNIVYGPLL
jgi:hypothetical protein